MCRRWLIVPLSHFPCSLLTAPWLSLFVSTCTVFVLQLYFLFVLSRSPDSLVLAVLSLFIYFNQSTHNSMYTACILYSMYSTLYTIQHVYFIAYILQLQNVAYCIMYISYILIFHVRYMLFIEGSRYFNTPKIAFSYVELRAQHDIQQYYCIVQCFVAQSIERYFI